ncbi:MAG: hypothetical protein NTY06_00735 [Candidatus Gottesmanbacteria bacterium]|nr:hypothetical protein [Candidatus Gottesmanbacteria bacterium]
MFLSKKYFETIIPIVLLAGFLLYLLYWRWQVSQLRFFDADEFTHLHWAAHVARGQLPYIDFFTYFSPGFMWLLTPLFWFFGVSWQIFLAARGLEFGIFTLLLGAVSLLFGVTRSWRWAVLPAVILAFLPLPYDKFLEVRPDTIATLFGCIGLLAEAVAIGKKGPRIRWWVTSGFFYGLSVIFLVKMTPFVIVGTGVAGLVSFQKKSIRELKAFMLGLFIPPAGLSIWAVLTGTFSAMWQALLISPFTIFNNLKDNYMAPYLFFYPNSAFYGNGERISAGLLVNHMLWLGALGVGTYRLLTPYVRARGNRDGVYVEILLALTFVLVAAGYIKFFPSKYSQYLIPVAVFVAYYAADGLSLFFDWLISEGGYTSMVIVMGAFVYLLVIVSQSVYAPKIIAANTFQRLEFNRLVASVPLSSRVVDLDGRMIFWKEGYSVCCLPFDDYLPYVSRAPQSLALYLSSHPADYVYQGDSNRLAGLLPENQAYVKSHFTPVPGFGDRLWKRNQ